MAYCGVLWRIVTQGSCGIGRAALSYERTHSVHILIREHILTHSYKRTHSVHILTREHILYTFL